MSKIADRLQKSGSSFKYDFENSCSSTRIITNGHFAKINARIEKRIKQNEIERAASKEVAGSYSVR